MLSMVVGSIVGGATTQKIGYYCQWAIIGSSLMAVGAGLLTTLQVDSSSSVWIGYQVLYGFGMGLCFQTPNLAVQTVLPEPDVPIGLALMFFGQLLGAAVIVAVGENVLGSQLLHKLSGIPGFQPGLVTSGGATSLVALLPAEFHDRALTAYNEALRTVFQVGLIVSCLSVIGAVGLEWRSIRAKPAPEAINKIGHGMDEKMADTAIA
jgi:MFS family permease